ncbi:MAG: hypothetical protein ACQETL_18645 [Bacteroidota bacterium]
MKNETDTLNERIRVLKEKRTEELNLLREQFQTTQESLKPFNLLKTTIKEISTSAEIKSNLLGTVIGLGAAVISNKFLIGRSINPIKNFIGTLLQFTIGNVISNRTKEVKSKVESFIHFFKIRRKESKINLQDFSKQNELLSLDYQNKTT